MVFSHFTLSISNFTDAFLQAAFSEDPLTYFDTDQYIKNFNFRIFFYHMEKPFEDISYECLINGFSFW